MPTPPSSVLRPSGLNLFRSGVYCHSHCGFICAYVFLVFGTHYFLGVICHLWLLQSFFYLLIKLELQNTLGKGLTQPDIKLK